MFVKFECFKNNIDCY
jgi:predicted RNase H-like nuclease (RuvC/YqgF family)